MGEPYDIIIIVSNIIEFIMQYPFRFFFSTAVLYIIIMSAYLTSYFENARRQARRKNNGQEAIQ